MDNLPQLQPAQPLTLEERLLEMLYGNQGLDVQAQKKLRLGEEHRAQPAVTGLTSQIPGGNPEVPTGADALVGMLMSMGGLPPSVARSGSPALQSPGNRPKPSSVLDPDFIAPEPKVVAEPRYAPAPRWGDAIEADLAASKGKITGELRAKYNLPLGVKTAVQARELVKSNRAFMDATREMEAAKKKPAAPTLPDSPLDHPNARLDQSPTGNAEWGVRKISNNMIEQLKQVLRDEGVGEGLFTTKGTKPDVMAAKVSSTPSAPGTAASFMNTGTLSEHIKTHPEYPVSRGLDMVGELKMNPKVLARGAQNPNDFAKKLIDTLSHEVGMHSLPKGSNHPDTALWTSRGMLDRGYADVPPLAQSTHPNEFTNQVRMDVMRERMLKTPLAQALLETSSDPNAPISQLWRALTDYGAYQR